MVSELNWKRIVVGGLAAALASVAAVMLVIFGYGLLLGIQAQGPPDREMVERFARLHSPWLRPAFLVVFTYVAALWVARRAGSRFQTHGLLTGVIAALGGFLLTRDLSLPALALTAVSVLAGWWGGWRGGRLATT